MAILLIYPATFFCLSQTRTWKKTIGTCHGLFSYSMNWSEMQLYILLILVELLKIWQWFKLSFQNPVVFIKNYVEVIQIFFFSGFSLILLLQNILKEHGNFFARKKKKQFKHNATILYQHFIFITSAQTDLPQWHNGKKIEITLMHV